MIPIFKKTKGLTRRAVLHHDFQSAVSEYFESKAEIRGRSRKYPEWDEVKLSPQITLLKTCQELSHVEEKLSAKRVEHLERRKNLDQQWDDMRNKEISFRNSFVHFDPFITENQAKRERVSRMIDEEKERQKEYKNQINRLENKLTYMNGVCDEIQKYVRDCAAAQNYLDRVVNETGEFQSIADIFNRHESLAEARQALADRQDQSLHDLEDIEADMQRMAAEKAHELISLNNELAILKTIYDRVRAEVLKWESVISRVKLSASRRSLQLTQIKSSCWSVYQQMCKRKGVAMTVSNDDIENQLIFIKQTIVELKGIVKTAKKISVKEK